MEANLLDGKVSSRDWFSDSVPKSNPDELSNRTHVKMLLIGERNYGTALSKAVWYSGSFHWLWSWHAALNWNEWSESGIGILNFNLFSEHDFKSFWWCTLPMFIRPSNSVHWSSFFFLCQVVTKRIWHTKVTFLSNASTTEKGWTNINFGMVSYPSLMVEWSSSQ